MMCGGSVQDISPPLTLKIPIAECLQRQGFCPTSGPHIVNITARFNSTSARVEVVMLRFNADT